MSRPASFGSPPLEGRSPFAAAEAVRAMIMRLSDDLTTEEAVNDAIVSAQGPGSQLYVDTIRRTRHSVFYHQIQELYSFGRNNVRDEHRNAFCRLAGREFLERVFAESLYPVLQMALARPGAFQTTVVEMLRATFYHYASETYLLEDEIGDTSIRLTLSWRRPEQAHPYLASYGLDPAQCFTNSAEFISGVIEAFCEKIVEGYDGSGYRFSLDGGRAHLDLPIATEDRFAYEALIPVLLGYIGDLKERQEAAWEDEQLESDLIVESKVMREKRHLIGRASRSQEIVLLRGESGTGKSFQARRVHDLSPRHDRPFVEVALTADIGSDNLIQSDLFGHEAGAFTGASELKEGLFSLADGGTIFLDEIGDASPELQSKLLRVLESSTFKRLGGVKDIRVDVRVIAATNRNLEQMVAEGRFRQDLYYRLNVIPVILPALRERREDVPALAEFLLARTSRASGRRLRLAPGLGEALQGYDWPGNIRELDHALKHAAAMAEDDTISVQHLPPAVRAALADADTHAPPRPPFGALGPTPPGGGHGIVDVEALVRHIRSTPALEVPGKGAYDLPAHVDYARRIWLATLIDECHGDLSLIARFWDRNSEKTLRNLVRSFGLADRLAEARQRRARS